MHTIRPLGAVILITLPIDKGLREQVADLRGLACRQVIGGLVNEAFGDEEETG